MKLNKLMPAILFPLALIGCTESVKPIPYTYTQVFTGTTSKTWTITQIKYTEVGKADLNLGLSSCAADDEYTFFDNSDHSYSVTEGATKCTSTDPDVIVDDIWSFNNSGAVLTIIMPIFDSVDRIPFIVNQASDNKIVLQIFLDSENKTSYKITLGLASQG